MQAKYLGLHSEQNARYKAQNEDAAVVGHVTNGSGLTLQLAVVADGVSTSEVGAAGSRCAVDLFLKFLEANQFATPKELGAIIGRFFRDANEAINRLGEEGSSTTFSAFVMMETGTLLAHIGDSRIAYFDEGKLRILTADHSLYGEALAAGAGDEELKGLSRSIITRWLGSTETPDPQIIVDPPAFTYGQGLILVTSDGVHDYMDDAVLVDSIKQHQADLSRLCQTVCQTAIGGRSYRGKVNGDNITICAIKAEFYPEYVAPIPAGSLLESGENDAEVTIHLGQPERPVKPLVSKNPEGFSTKKIAALWIAVCGVILLGTVLFLWLYSTSGGEAKNSIEASAVPPALDSSIPNGAGREDPLDPTAGAGGGKRTQNGETQGKGSDPTSPASGSGGDPLTGVNEDSGPKGGSIMDPELESPLGQNQQSNSAEENLARHASEVYNFENPNPEKRSPRDASGQPTEITEPENSERLNQIGDLGTVTGESVSEKIKWRVITNLHLRRRASSTAPSETLISGGELVFSYGEETTRGGSYEWLSVIYKGEMGWVAKEFLERVN